MKMSVHQVLLKLEDQANQTSRMHLRHPAVLVLIVLAWIGFLSSYDRHVVLGLLPYSLFIYFWVQEAALDTKLIAKGLFKTEPFILAIALMNPIFEKGSFQWMGFHVSYGILTALNIVIKGNLSILLTLCLMATIGVNGLATALTTLRLPKILIDTLVMTYRYIIRFTEEVETRWIAYQLRVPSAKGIDLSAAGSFIGQLMIRSLERGETVHQAMALRGSTELPKYDSRKINSQDLLFMSLWLVVAIVIKVASQWLL